MKFFLASSSPARLQALKKIDITPDAIIAADIDETALKAETPKILAARLAKAKAEKIAELVIHQMLNLRHSDTDGINNINNHNEDIILLASDTVAALGRKILPKAENDQQVRYCLSQLSGKNHHVFTGLCVIKINRKKLLDFASDANMINALPKMPDQQTLDFTAMKQAGIIQTCQKLSHTKVKFCRLTKTDIEYYISKKYGLNKAGGCCIQGFAERYVEKISGSISNITGLPTLVAANMLKGLGFFSLHLK